MAIATIGLDLAKPEFPLVGYNDRFKEVKRRTLHRHQVLAHFDRLPSCRVGMESCPGAQYWGRLLELDNHLKFYENELGQLDKEERPPGGGRIRPDRERCRHPRT